MGTGGASETGAGGPVAADECIEAGRRRHDAVVPCGTVFRSAVRLTAPAAAAMSPLHAAAVRTAAAAAVRAVQVPVGASHNGRRDESSRPEERSLEAEQAEDEQQDDFP